MSKDSLNQCLEAQDFSGALNHSISLINNGEQGAQIIAVKGWSLYKLGRFVEAEVDILAAFEQELSNAQVATIAISFFMELARYDKVVELCQRCIAFHANDRLMWHRLATSHYLIGEYAASVMAFRRGLLVQNSAASAFGLSQPLLCQGQYEEGFKLYENRFIPHPQLNWLQCEKMPMPKWSGEPLQGKALLVWSEQGLGDSIQFGRIVTELVEQGASVDLMLHSAHGTLADLLATIKGVGRITVVKGKEICLHRRYDYHCPLMSLMMGIKLTPQTIPANIPYISLPDNYQFQWPEAINPKNLPADQLKIGIVWTTALSKTLEKENFMHYALKDQKSLLFKEVQSLFSVNGARFFSLHISLPDEDKAAINTHNIIDMAPYIKSFTDTAAIIDEMDLVISIDTSVVHLAGAMGKPTINLLPYVNDWRWQNHREDSPWYPTMRLMTQHWRDDWSSLVEQLTIQLRKTVAHYQKTQQVVIV